MNLRNKKLFRTVQIIFGLYLLFTVVSSIFQILPPPQLNESATSFITALFNTGYIFYVMFIVFILCGLMFVFNKWSALGAVLLAPITLNILLFHIFLDFSGWWIALVFAIVHIYLLAMHLPKYKAMLQK